MTIAAHIALNKNSGTSFLAEYLKKLARRFPENHFIFFIDHADATSLFPVANCTCIVISPKIKNSLLLHYWYNFKLPFFIKRYDADVFISENGVISSRIDTPQVMIVEDISIVKKTTARSNKYSRYLHKFFPSFLKKAAAIITTEKYIADILVAKYPFTAAKTFPVYPALNKIYHSISWEQKENITAQYSEEKDYFLYPVSNNTKNNIVYVLKAFSQFKKWQKSNMQLVLFLQNVVEEKLVKDFGLYKYRNEVKFITVMDDKDSAKIIAAAYAFIYLPQEEKITYSCLNAMQCEVPVITTGSHLNKSMYDHAVIYTAIDEKAIAEKMMALYKDENLRKDCIKKGLLQISKYTEENTLVQLWEAIIKTNEQ